MRLDVSKEADHIAAFAQAEKEFGGVDAIFANAGYEGDVGVGLVDKTESEIKTAIDTNIVGVILSAKHGVIAMRKRGGGTFAICSSGAAFNGQALAIAGWPMGMDMTTWSVYSATKAAVDTFGRLMHHYLPENIRTYRINPFFFHSEMALKIAGKMTLGETTAAVDGLGAAFNPIDQSGGGNPQDIAELFLTMCDNSTLHPPSSGVAIDHDFTMNAKVFLRYVEEAHLPDTPYPPPEILKQWARNVDGTVRSD